MNVSFFPIHLASTKNQIRNNTVIKKFKDNTHTILSLNNIESRPFFPLHSIEYIFFSNASVFYCFKFFHYRKLERIDCFLYSLGVNLIFFPFCFCWIFFTWNWNIDWMENMNRFKNGTQTGKKSFNSLKNIHFSTFFQTFSIHYHNGLF